MKSNASPPWFRDSRGIMFSYSGPGVTEWGRERVRELLDKGYTTDEVVSQIAWSYPDAQMPPSDRKLVESYIAEAQAADAGMTEYAKQKIAEIPKVAQRLRNINRREPSIRLMSLPNNLGVDRQTLTTWIDRGWTKDTGWQPARRNPAK